MQSSFIPAKEKQNDNNLPPPAVLCPVSCRPNGSSRQVFGAESMKMKGISKMSATMCSVLGCSGAQKALLQPSSLQPKSSCLLINHTLNRATHSALQPLCLPSDCFPTSAASCLSPPSGSTVLCFQTNDLIRFLFARLSFRQEKHKNKLFLLLRDRTWAGQPSTLIRLV